MKFSTCRFYNTTCRFYAATCRFGQSDLLDLRPLLFVCGEQFP